MKGVEKERDKKRDILSCLTNQRERERERRRWGAFIRVPGPERKSERKTQE